jgi:hypothetical protein
VRKFLHDHVDPGVFAPDAVRTLLAAFDGAWQSILASGARLSAQQTELTRELLAKYIIEQARQGELDERRLRDGALLHLSQSNLRRPPTNSRLWSMPGQMDQEMLKRHLAEAEEHIATVDKNIARQRDVIAQLERDGRDTASARIFLHEFEQLQARHIAERERLLRELSEL